MNELKIITVIVTRFVLLLLPFQLLMDTVWEDMPDKPLANLEVFRDNYVSTTALALNL